MFLLVHRFIFLLAVLCGSRRTLSGFGAGCEENHLCWPSAAVYSRIPPTFSQKIFFPHELWPDWFWFQVGHHQTVYSIYLGLMYVPMLNDGVLSDAKWPDVTLTVRGIYDASLITLIQNWTMWPGPGWKRIQLALGRKWKQSFEGWRLSALIYSVSSCLKSHLITS